MAEVRRFQYDAVSMPHTRKMVKEQLAAVLQDIAARVYTPVSSLEISAWWSREPVPFAERTTGDPRSLAVGDVWGDLFDCAWFRFTGTVPASSAGKHVVLLLDVSGELCAYDSDGTPARGLTSVGSGFDANLGSPGKRVLQVARSARGGERVVVWADAGCNDLFGTLTGNGIVAQASIAVCDDEVRALQYDFEVLLDLAYALPESTARHHRIREALRVAATALAGFREGAATEARRTLAPVLAERGGSASLTVSAIGHAHIDLAWLWPIRETIRKTERTFSTVVELMGRYPEYRFGASQPQLYWWIRERHPRLYERIRELVNAGRFEPQGALWVEADANITGAESLVRQLLFGIRFFREEFGVDINYAWLPDVFGFPGSLPQILKLAGVDYFLTQKLSWSRVNTFPYHSFHWCGIDGTSILTHMFPENTYNSPAAPRSLATIETNYREKGVSTHALMPFGIGDGGGGPGAGHLERLSRLENLAGVAPVVQEPVAAFLEKWSAEADAFPTWVGELYLERHQGTLTTQAAVKRLNRELEFALRDWEWTAVVAKVLIGRPYPREALTRVWRETLLYQFHDILPGSSIKRVYDECLPRYESLITEVRDRVASNYAALNQTLPDDSGGSACVVWNGLSWHRDEWLKLPDGWARASVPSMGYTLVRCSHEPLRFPDVRAAMNELENDVLRIQFGSNGAVLSVYDKEQERELIAAGCEANLLAAYPDSGDAWDLAADYRLSQPQIMELTATRVSVDGPQAIVEQHYQLGNSTIRERIGLTAGSRRIDFVAEGSWREKACTLRTSFPLALHAEHASFDVQFGHVWRATHRNTSWERAKDEVAAHKWVDVSQRDYGVALLNNCKYGHQVKDSVIDLALIRSVPYPGPATARNHTSAGEPDPAYTDQSDHTFVYSLLPHPGDHVDGGVARAAYELHVPLKVIPRSGGSRSTAGTTAPGARHRSFLRVEPPGVIVETVKLAEDGDDVILRLYESEHRSVTAEIQFGFPITRVALVNLLEEHPDPVLVTGDTVRVPLGPFEIKTLRVGAAEIS